MTDTALTHLAVTNFLEKIGDQVEEATGKDENEDAATSTISSATSITSTTKDDATTVSYSTKNEDFTTNYDDYKFNKNSKFFNFLETSAKDIIVNLQSRRTTTTPQT